MKNIHVLPTGETIAGIKTKNIYITSDEEIKDVRPHKGKWQLEQGQILNKFPTYLTDLSECKLVIMTTDQDLIKDGVQAIDDEFLEWFVKNPSCEFVEVKNGIKRLNSDGEEIGFPDMSSYKIIIPKEENFKHELRVLSKEEVLTNRSSAYEFIDFDKQETLEEVAERLFKQYSNYTPLSEGYYDYMINKEDFKEASLEIAKWQQERSYSEEDMIQASKYGYNFHKTTQFPNQEFEDSCIRNTQQWLTKFKNK